MSSLAEALQDVLAYGDGGTEIVIEDRDVQCLISESPRTAHDPDNQINFSTLPSTSAMSVDSGFEEDVLTPPAGQGKPAGEPTLLILDQPQKTYDFRYLDEYKNKNKKPEISLSGPLRREKHIGVPLKNSKGPRVKLVNFTGKAVIRMWLWGFKKKSRSPSPSPHRMMTMRGQDLIDEPHDIEVNAGNDYTASFDKFNIIHVVTRNEKQRLHQKLYLKKSRNVAKQGGTFIPKGEIPEVEDFNAEAVKEAWKLVDKNICFLYFEAFEKRGQEYIQICSVRSEPIKNLKNPETTRIHIVEQFQEEGTCEGGTEIVLLTQKFSGKIKIVFECVDEQYKWREEVEDVRSHHQVAFWFNTPQFESLDITSPVKAKFYILRIEDNERSDVRHFRFLPKRHEDSTTWDSCQKLVPEAKRKRHQPHEDSSSPSSDDVPLDQSAMVNTEEENRQILADALEEQVTPNAVQNHELTTPVCGMLDESLQQHSTPGQDSNEELEQILKRFCAEFGTEGGNPQNLFPDLFSDLSVTSMFPTDHLEDMSAKVSKNGDLMKMSARGKARILHWSIVTGCNELFRKLDAIDAVNVQLRNESALHLAVACGRPSMVARLLELGSDPYALDGDGNTAVHVAIEKSQLCLQTILSSAVEPRAIFNKEGDDPVLFAVRKENVTALRFLLTKEFRPFSSNVKDGNSPLHVAVKCREQNTRRSMVDVLLKVTQSSSDKNLDAPNSNVSVKSGIVWLVSSSMELLKLWGNSY